MDKRRAERGEGRVGVMISLILVAIGIFLGVKIIPVRVSASEFTDHIREVCRYAATHKNDDEVTRRIIEKAEELEIPLSKKNLEVKRTRSEMIITASYEQSVDLKVYTYVYKFHTKERAPLF